MITLSNYKSVQIVAEEIKELLGLSLMYTDKNERHPSAPNNIRLGNVVHIAEIFNTYFRSVGHAARMRLLTNPRIFGLYSQHSNKCHVRLSANANVCERRFIVLKELCVSLLSYWKEIAMYSKTMDILTFASHTVAIIPYVIELSYQEIQEFCNLVVGELMVPSEYRHITYKLVNDAQSGIITVRNIAESLVVPERVLLRVLVS